MPSPRALFFHPFRAGLWPCGTVYLPGHMGCYAHPAYLPAPGGARPLWGGGVSVSNGNEIPSPSVSPGAALLDLEQTTLPGIAHLVVETMIVSDQIRPEDRASVLRTLLLKHRCQAGAPGRGDGLQVQLPSGSTDSLEWLFPVCLNTLRDRELIPSPIRKYQPLESSFLH